MDFPDVRLSQCGQFLNLTLPIRSSNLRFSASCKISVPRIAQRLRIGIQYDVCGVEFSNRNNPRHSIETPAHHFCKDVALGGLPGYFRICHFVDMEDGTVIPT